MRCGIKGWGWLAFAQAMLLVSVARGQEGACASANIDAMRGRASIGASDQRRIAEWVETQIDGFQDWAGFRECFGRQLSDAGNSPQFSAQMVEQTSEVAAGRFANPAFGVEVAHALARVLVDMNRPETYAGLVGGLGHAEATVRYVCVLGLLGQRSSVVSDQVRLGPYIKALRDAGVAERSPVVLGRIYEALAIPGQVSAVFDAYMALFDKRLADRRKTNLAGGGSERYAFEYFRSSAVLGSLNAQQKAQLVARVAVFMRLAAERYNIEGLEVGEIDLIERVLDGAEEILAGVVGGSQGGKVRDVLQAGAPGGNQAVLQEVYRWVGDSAGEVKGVLNEAPWGVAAGAP